MLQIAGQVGFFFIAAGLKCFCGRYFLFNAQVTTSQRGGNGEIRIDVRPSQSIFYAPVDRGFERDLKKRLEYFAKLRIQRES